jgi:hypothetical protein
MGPLKACVLIEQNANVMGGGVQVATALIGSGGTTINAVQVGAAYIVAGTQTSSLAQIILDINNTPPGYQFLVRKYTTAVIGTGAAQVQVVSGSAAGAVVGAFQVGTAAPNEIRTIFDGVQWR